MSEIERAQNRGFLLGILWSAWCLHRRGEDFYAEELLAETGALNTLQRLARAEQYPFKRGFWAEIKRRAA